MSRIRSAITALDRRSFLAVTGAVGISSGIGLTLGTGRGGAVPPDVSGSAAGHPAATTSIGPTTPNTPNTPTPVVAPGRTTLESVATPRNRTAPFRRLTDGPGWQRVVRDTLAAGRPGRAGRRTVLSSFVQLTDLHLVDVQHPVRTEYLRSLSRSAWRPQEALTVPGAVSLVEQVNALATGPATGAPLSFVMTTGDNTDNNSRAELDWFLTAMSGGTITPNTGDRNHYEGVQNCGDRLFWQPDDARRDTDKQAGFPTLEGFLAAAIRPVDSPGLHIPWYSTIGNHDSLASGAIADRTGWLAEFAVGPKKLYSVPGSEAEALSKVLGKGDRPGGGELIELLQREKRRMRSITADPGRAPFTPRDYLAAHLDPARTGPGPVGHGYTTAHLDSDTLYYTFPMGENVIGISLDTTDRAGHFTGSIDTTQLKWLEQKLTEYQDGYVVVFSHHNSWTMTNTHPDPATGESPQERRRGAGPAQEAPHRSSPGSTDTATAM